MKFEYTPDGTRTIVSISKESMSNNSTHIGIEFCASDGFGEYVKDYIALYMCVEEVEDFIEQLSDSLGKYKTWKNRYKNKECD